MRLKDAPYDIAQYTSPQKILEQLILLTVGHSLLADNLLEAEMYNDSVLFRGGLS